MAKTRQQINWKSVLEDGTPIDVRAVRFPKDWTLKYRPRGTIDWVYGWDAPISEWETLLDALQRRYQRRSASPEDLKEVKTVIQRLRHEEGA
jgi:hypothetical protein